MAKHPKPKAPQGPAQPAPQAIIEIPPSGRIARPDFLDQLSRCPGSAPTGAPAGASPPATPGEPIPITIAHAGRLWGLIGTTPGAPHGPDEDNLLLHCRAMYCRGFAPDGVPCRVYAVMGTAERLVCVVECED